MQEIVEGNGIPVENVEQVEPTAGDIHAVEEIKEITDLTNTSLKTDLTPRNASDLTEGELCEEYNKMDARVLKITELIDPNVYSKEAVLHQMLFYANEYGYTDVKLCDKKVAEDGKLISIGLQGLSPKYGGCYSILRFDRKCKRENGPTPADTTCIAEEYYGKDNSFSMPDDQMEIHNY